VTASRAPRFSERVEDALAWSARLHRAQWRRAQPVPYLGHLLGVAALVIDDGGDEDEVIAALLHDAVEDQGGEATRVEIARRYGARVAAIVEACSERDAGAEPWRARKQRHVDRLFAADASVRRVYAADKVNNLRSLQQGLDEGVDVWSLFRGGRDGTLWYFRAVLEALRSAGGGTLVERFARELAGLETRVAGGEGAWPR
jgi:(p)ppGpp synthase/HD superfamily hydrolase